MNNIYILFFIYYIVAIILIIVVLNIMQMIKIKKLKKEIDFLEKQKNSIIDAPIIIELSKAENLIKNENLKGKVQTWKQIIEEIKTNKLNDISDSLLEVDFLIEKRQYKNLNLQKIQTELKIYEANELKNKVFSEIQEITLCEDKNRSIIANLKIRFRQVLTDFEIVRVDLKDLEETVKLQIENIEKRFKDFETLLENQEYDEVNIIVSSIEKLINHIEIILKELPSAILMIQNIIPKRIEEIKIENNNLLSEGYQLDFLNVEYNLSEINKKISNANSKISVLNLEDVIFELKTILEYFDSLYADFEKEKTSRKRFEEKQVTFKSKYEKIEDHINKLDGKIEDTNFNYELNTEQSEILELLKTDLLKLENNYVILNDTVRTSSISYSKLLNEIEVLISKLSKLETEIEIYSEKVLNMKEDEKRARDELEKINEILKVSKYKIRDYKLPVVPKCYYVELQDAIDSIKEIRKELERKPINIEVLNIRVDNARDLVLKFSNNTNETIKTAIMAENVIIYGNRYKSNRESIYESIKKSEFLFIKGEYKKSLELILNAINVIEPGIYDKLKKLYENK